MAALDLNMTEQPQSENPYTGEFILNQLRRMGSDVSRKHDVSFWLYFPYEASARDAADRARKAGLSPEISPPLKDSSSEDWLCLLYCPHIPDESILDGISVFAANLASELGGRFDGWEASLELEQGANPTLT